MAGATAPPTSFSPASRWTTESVPAGPGASRSVVASKLFPNPPRRAAQMARCEIELKRVRSQGAPI